MIPPPLTPRGEDSPPALVDRFGRSIRKLRLSVTDRCHYRCGYCLPVAPPEGWLPKHSLLTFEEIERVARIFIGLGIRAIRLTGGEPLVRKGIPELVRRLSAIDGISNLAMTTNGRLLTDLAEPLKKSGLRTVNVSLDSLTPGTYTRITGVDALPEVLHAIDAAIGAGLHVKVNAVLVRGLNHEELESLAELAAHKPIEIRFIEWMPTARSDSWSRERVVSATEIEGRLSKRVRLKPLSAPEDASPARLFAPEGWPGRIGIIPSVSSPFCARCDRLRLTANGKLISCLYGVDRQVDMIPAVRGGATDKEIELLLRESIRMKPFGSASWIEHGPGPASTPGWPSGDTTLPSMHWVGG